MFAIATSIFAAMVAGPPGPQFVRSIVTDGFLQGPDRNIAVDIGDKGHRWDAWVAHKNNGYVDRIVFTYRDEADKLVIQKPYKFTTDSTAVDSFGGVVDDRGNFFVAYADANHQVVMRATPSGLLSPRFVEGITRDLVPVRGGGVIRCGSGLRVNGDSDVWVSRLSGDNAVVWEDQWDEGTSQRVRGCDQKGDHLYATSSGSRPSVRSYDPDDGSVRWTKALPKIDGLHIRDAYVHPSGDAVVVALTSRSGHKSNFHFFRYKAENGKLTHHHVHPAGVWLTVSSGADPERTWVTQAGSGTAVVAYRTSGSDTPSWSVLAFTFDATPQSGGGSASPKTRVAGRIKPSVAGDYARRISRTTLGLPGGVVKWDVDLPSSLQIQLVGIVPLIGNNVGLVGFDEAVKSGETKKGSRTRLVVVRGNGTIMGAATYTSSAADRQNMPVHVGGDRFNVFVGGQQSKISGPSFAEKDATRVHFALPQLDQNARKKALRRRLGR